MLKVRTKFKIYDQTVVNILNNSVPIPKLYHLDNRMAVCQLWITVLALNMRKERLLTCSQPIKSPPVVLWVK